MRKLLIVVLILSLVLVGCTIENKGRQMTGLGAEFDTVITAEFGGNQGNDHTHGDIGYQSQNAQCHMVAADKADHNDAEKKCNADGRNGMGIEHFQQLNIRSNNGDQIALILAL